MVTFSQKASSAAAAAVGAVCNIRCGPSNISTLASGLTDLTNSQQFARTTKSRVAWRYNIGTLHARNSFVTSTLNTARVRAAKAAGKMDRTTDLAMAPKCPNEYEPRRIQDKIQRGCKLNIQGPTDILHLSGNFSGDCTNEAHKTIPHNPGGCRAESMTASGPEKDSPTTTKGPGGTASSTMGSNSS